MTPFYTDDWLTLYGGDCREVLASLPSDSVDCVVTSPPYWGLRDYGSEGQLGLERTPEEYVANMVAVFREVRRVLKPSGTCWLNLGSSYISEDGYPLKPTDAAWLAGLIDGEGCIQVHRQKRPEHTNSVDSFQIDLSVGMMTAEAVQKAHQITGLGSCGMQNRGVWDWSVRGQQTATLLRALYPFLVTKRRQAAYAVMLAEDLARNKFGRGRPATAEAMEYRQAIKEAISALNQRQEPTLPMVEPRPIALGVKAKDDALIPEQMAIALRQDGWYLRSDIIWSKSNPMPESVTDRPTKSHEYLFLLTKSSRYFFDSDAVRESAIGHTHHDLTGPGYRAPGQTPQTGNRERLRPEIELPEGRTEVGAVTGRGSAGRNIRSVWNIATRPYPGAHFAVFPPELPERCIKAGSSQKGVCPECGAPWERMTTGGWRSSCGHSDRAAGIAELWPLPAVVLDPFGGSGTVGMVANRLSRRAILIDLNPEYLKQQMKRNAQTPLGLDAA